MTNTKESQARSDGFALLVTGAVLAVIGVVTFQFESDVLRMVSMWSIIGAVFTLPAGAVLVATSRPGRTE